MAFRSSSPYELIPRFADVFRASIFLGADRTWRVGIFCFSALLHVESTCFYDTSHVHAFLRTALLDTAFRLFLEEPLDGHGYGSGGASSSCTQASWDRSRIIHGTLQAGERGYFYVRAAFGETEDA